MVDHVGNLAILTPEAMIRIDEKWSRKNKTALLNRLSSV
jgi:hypothetical protein